MPGLRRTDDRSHQRVTMEVDEDVERLQRIERLIVNEIIELENKLKDAKERLNENKRQQHQGTVHPPPA